MMIHLRSMLNPGSRLRWSMPTWWTTLQSGNLISPSHDNNGLYWTVSAPVKGIAEPVDTDCAPVVRPKRCPTSSNPDLLPGWTVVCLSFTLLMLLLLPGWPTMGLNRIRKKKKNVDDGYRWQSVGCPVMVGDARFNQIISNSQRTFAYLRTMLWQVCGL